MFLLKKNRILLSFEEEITLIDYQNKFILSSLIDIK